MVSRLWRGDDGPAMALPRLFSASRLHDSTDLGWLVTGWWDLFSLYMSYEQAEGARYLASPYAGLIYCILTSPAGLPHWARMQAIISNLLSAIEYSRTVYSRWTNISGKFHAPRSFFTSFTTSLFSTNRPRSFSSSLPISFNRTWPASISSCPRIIVIGTSLDALN